MYFEELAIVKDELDGTQAPPVMRNTVRGTSLRKSRKISKVLAHLACFAIDQLINIERNRKDAMKQLIRLKPSQDHMNIVEMHDVIA